MAALQWWQTGVIYQIYPRSFQDTNGDGIGDFQGLLRRLDYLHGLGVTAIWLMPFQTSPGRDDGYDIADYMTVHPSYGTLDDFKAFLDAAHDCLCGSSMETVSPWPVSLSLWERRTWHAPIEV